MRLLNILSFALALNCVYNKIRLKFDWGYLKQDKITFNHVKIVNVYIVYALSSNLNNFNSTLKNCLFVAVKLTKNTDTDKYKYSGYGTGFDSCRKFSFPSCKFTQNVIIFAVDMSFSVHDDNKKKLTADKKYSINFTVTERKFCLSLDYNGANNYLFVNSTEIIKFKAKDSEIVATPLCLGNISEDFATDNMRKAKLYGYAYDFSVYYDAIAADNIPDIHKYLMKKNGIV